MGGTLEPGVRRPGEVVRMARVRSGLTLAELGNRTGYSAAQVSRYERGVTPLADLVKRYEAAGGRYYVCPICFNARKLSPESLIADAELQGTVPMWAWIGDDAATTFSY